MTLAAPDLGNASIVARLGGFLSLQLERPVQVEAFVRLTGGLSWITGIFTVRIDNRHPFDGRQLVVKVGPPRGLMAPYSTAPQASALKIFAGSITVRVPELLWSSDDLDILGAPFLITSKVDGAELNPFLPGCGIEDPGALLSVGAQFADALGEIHAADFDTVEGGPAGSGVATASGAEQADAWYQRYQMWADKPYPVIEFAASWLRRNSPVLSRTVVVHGDYRVGNFLVRGGQVTAILDWEMMHFGDPHEDLSWVMLPELGLKSLISHEDFIERYQARSGMRVLPESMRYYRIFTYYKLALINIGGISGFESGSRDLRMACMGFLVPLYLRRLARALQELL